MSEDDILTVDEVAELFRISRAYVYRAINEGKLAATQEPVRVLYADARKWREPVFRVPEAEPQKPKRRVRRRKDYPMLGANRGKAVNQD